MTGTVVAGGVRAELERTKRRAAFDGMERMLQKTDRAGSSAKSKPSRTRSVTKIYRSLVLALAGRIVQRSLTMQQCDDLSGLQDGYVAKLLHPDTGQGRVAGWYTLQLLIDALYPDGVEVVLIPVQPGAYDPVVDPRPDRRGARLLSDIAAGLVKRSANDDAPTVRSVTL